MREELKRIRSEIIDYLMDSDLIDKIPEEWPHLDTIYYVAEKKLAESYISKDICKSAVVDVYSVRAMVEKGVICRYDNKISIIMEYLDTHEERIVTAEEYLNIIANNGSYENIMRLAKVKTHKSALNAADLLGIDDISIPDLLNLVEKHSIKELKDPVTC